MLSKFSWITNILRKIKHIGTRVAARIWLNVFRQEVLQIAITGSYGKTSVSNAIYRIISFSQPTLMTDLELDTIHNVPNTVLRLRKEKVIVFELGIDRLHEMDFHLQIVKPHITVITGITPVHSDEKHMKSLENIVVEKRRAIEVLGPNDFAVLNHDDPHVREMEKFTRAQVIWYGVSPTCNVQIHSVASSTEGVSFKVNGQKSNYSISSKLLGKHSAYNLGAAIAVAEIIGMRRRSIVEAIKEIEPLPGRLNIEAGPLELMLVNDMARANPASTKAGLDFVKGINVGGQKLAVIGEMGELGDSAIPKHKEIGEIAAKTGIDLLVCIGELTRYIAQEAQENGMPNEKVFYVSTPQEAAQVIKDFAHEGDLLYIKASLFRHLERVVMVLSGQDVVCNVKACHFYHSCSDCSYRTSGLQNYPEIN